MTRPMRIAMLGSRGVPATFGGIERHVEEIGSRLARRGHEVTVYCRPGYVGRTVSEHAGMRLRVLPAVRTKHLEALSHTGVSSCDALLRGYDIYHYHAVGPGMLSALPRLLSGQGRVVLTVHGLDFDREKWGAVGRRLFGLSGWLSAHVPDRTVVVAKNLDDYYRARYDRATTFIRNGVTLPAAGETAASPSPSPYGRYVLFVGRLTPEKGPHLLIEAFRRLADPGLRLCIVGGTSYTNGYVAQVRAAAAADERISCRGYVYGAELAELYRHAAVFAQPSTLEGMPLTILEAGSHGLPIVASDIAVHQELLGRDAPGSRLFSSGSVADLTAALARSLADPVAERRGARTLQEQVATAYCWEDVVDELEQLYEGALAADRTRPRARPRAMAGSRA